MRIYSKLSLVNPSSTAIRDVSANPAASLVFSTSRCPGVKKTSSSLNGLPRASFTQTAVLCFLV